MALKVILSGELASAAEIERFETEAKAVAQLQHPNIVPVHDFGEVEGRHYFSMAFVDGPNLGQWSRENHPSPGQAATITRAVARAIHYSHQRGIFHRDLKPANILMDRQSGQPQVTDFGLAKFAFEDQGLTRSGAIMGIPNYMPPEQALGRLDLIGPPTDVFSIGAILYELLTGRPLSKLRRCTKP